MIGQALPLTLEIQSDDWWQDVTPQLTELLAVLDVKTARACRSG
jgi:hypothetical protein